MKSEDESGEDDSAEGAGGWVWAHVREIHRVQHTTEADGFSEADGGIDDWGCRIDHSYDY